MNSIKSYEKADRSVQMDITIERNLDLTTVDRDGYTVLDLISDIGGIQGILFSAVAVIMSFWNYNFLDNFLVSKLYRIKYRSSATNDNERVLKEEKIRVEDGALHGVRDAVCNNIPAYCRCRCKDRNQRGLALGRDKLYKETNIVK